MTGGVVDLLKKSNETHKLRNACRPTSFLRSRRSLRQQRLDAKPPA